MRYIVQRPLPDELLSSVWLRTARRSGLPIGTVARALTSGRKWSPSFFNAGHVEDLAPWMGMAPVDLLWRHTVFPYATAFFEPAVFESALAAALSTGHAAVGMGAVTQSVSDHVLFRRFCPVCAREDRKRWGESYWHRAHNLPGVLLCLGHGCSLRETDLRTSGTRSWTYALPHELRQASTPLKVRADRERVRAFNAEMARLSVAVLERHLVGTYGANSVPPMPREPDWYREALVTQGLLSPNRLVNVQQLAAWAAGIVGGKATRLGFNEKDADLKWLGLMVRPKVGIPFVPLKHLVFKAVLALQVKAELMAATHRRQATGRREAGFAASNDAAKPRVLDHVPTGLSGPTAQQTALRDKQFAAAVDAVVRSYVKRGMKVRVQDALTEAGCWSAFRHAPTAFPRVQAQVKNLRLSDVSVRPISAQMGELL